MSTPELPEVVQLAEVRHLLDRLIGYEGEDWRIERWDEPYEGWTGALRPTCVCDGGGCWCCDPINLHDGDLALLARIYPPASDDTKGVSDA